MKLGVIVLAAGSASRMGKAKMLLPFKENPILIHILNEVKAIHPAAICLVTGKYAVEIETVLDESDVVVEVNTEWTKGMSGSINVGLKKILETQPLLDAVLIVVSDQPFLDRQLLARMLDAYQHNGKGIVAATYAGIKGTPVLFAKRYFEAIEKLVGDQGARVILQTNPEDLVAIDFPLGALDIDTEEDYHKLQGLLNGIHAERQSS
jgi:molybdenum cofactor cytidylyltransferase